MIGVRTNQDCAVEVSSTFDVPCTKTALDNRASETRQFLFYSSELLDNAMAMDPESGDLMERIQAQVHAQISEGFREQVCVCLQCISAVFCSPFGKSHDLTC